MLPRLLKTIRITFRQAIALLVVLGMCASIIPLPMTVPVTAEKDRSTPFPCQDRPCGCASAKQCWKSCCCFTDSQKLAWAKANHVTPPDYVIAAAEKEASEKSQVVKNCCAQHSVESQIVQAVTPSCCQKSASAEMACCKSAVPAGCCQEDSTSVAENEESTVKTQTVLTAFVLRCHGQSNFFWNSIPWSDLVFNTTELPAMNMTGSVCLLSETLIECPLNPPEPPPRLA
ncbi:hypothetical protein [uncultured Rubinisphaera sp.]|uniref:hypothetical protein n=1 Tax=uncultured Rubinisphaera sp. TaxID=1678686 RepID=UPI0030D9E0B8|tara:strand:- start:100 stop:789 length:690 start_codon:yes stop_codon:yes gene_type:complete